MNFYELLPLHELENTTLQVVHRREDGERIIYEMF